MKKGWTYKKLGEVCDILDYMRKPITKGKRESGDIPYYGATGCLDYVKDYIFDEKLVLLGEDGAKWGAGETSSYIIEGKSWVNNHAHALRPRREILLDEILVYYLNYSNLLPFITGVTVPKLNQEKMRSIDIPIAPIKEQKWIVERLDAAFAQIDELKTNAEKQLAEARALFQKSLAKAMEPKEGWEEKTIGELTDSCLGKMLDKQKNRGEYQPYLRNINVRWGGFDLSDILEMKFEDGEDERYGIKTGDLIICEGGEPGRCAIWEGQIENMKIQKALHRVRSKGHILNRYLYYSIMFYALSGFLEKYESGATIKHLTGEALRKIPLSYPSLSEQQRIVERLDSISENVRKYEEIQRKIIAECDALKQALLRQVFE